MRREMNKQSENSDSAKAEQRPGIVAADLDSILLGNFDGIEPRRCLRMILERIIDGEQHAVGADSEDGVDQRLRAEIAARRDVKIFTKIFGHGPLCRPVRNLAEPAIEPPQIERDALAE